jgi:DNA-binding transcriptional ArsR family regulator
MLDVTVIEDPAAAAVSLDPVRARLLAELSEPASATMLAARVGLARQKVNYHLKALERYGLVELVEERRKGNVNERMVRRHRGVLRHLSRRARRRATRSRAVAGPPVGELVAGGGGAAGP